MPMEVMLDDDTLSVLEAATRIAGLTGRDRLLIAIRRALNLRDYALTEAFPDTHAIELDAKPTMYDLDQMRLDSNLKGTKPAFWVGPDGIEHEVTHWSDVVAGIAEYLKNQGAFHTDQPPIGEEGRIHPVVSEELDRLSHPAVAREFAHHWWVETWGNVNTKGRNLRRLARAVGYPPSDFKVALR